MTLEIRDHYSGLIKAEHFDKYGLTLEGAVAMAKAKQCNNDTALITGEDLEKMWHDVLDLLTRHRSTP